MLELVQRGLPHVILKENRNIFSLADRILINCCQKYPLGAMDKKRGLRGSLDIENLAYEVTLPGNAGI